MRSIVGQLLFVPRCAVCRRRFSVSFDGVQPSLLCEECERSFQRAMRSTCARCGAPFFSCICAPSPMRRVGFAAFVKLAPYSEEGEDRVMRRILLDSKKRPLDRAMERLADELRLGIGEALIGAGYSEHNALLVPLPRAVKNERRYGTDQAKALATALSRATGIPYGELVHRARVAPPQKMLNAPSRANNLTNVFRADAVPPGTCVLLVDDVVTTGATMEAAGRALKRAGAKVLIAVAPAYTKKKRNRA